MYGVVGLQHLYIYLKGSYLERYIIESDSLVLVPYIYNSSILSRAGHVKPCLKQRRPRRKAKYSWETDSEQVPWGKGEKNPEQGSEIEPETVCLQAVGALMY